MPNTLSKNANIIRTFRKDKRYTIVEMDGTLFALYDLKETGEFTKKFECIKFAKGLYGIGPEIKD